MNLKKCVLIRKILNRNEWHLKETSSSKSYLKSVFSLTSILVILPNTLTGWSSIWGLAAIWLTFGKEPLMYGLRNACGWGCKCVTFRGWGGPWTILDDRESI